MLAPRDMQCVDYIHYNEIAKYRIGKQGVIFDFDRDRKEHTTELLGKSENMMVFV